MSQLDRAGIDQRIAFAFVVIGQRESRDRASRASMPRRSIKRGVSRGFGQVVGPRHENAFAQGFIGLQKARVQTRAHAFDDIVRDAAAAMQLNRKIEAPRAQRARNAGRCASVSCCSGKPIAPGNTINSSTQMRVSLDERRGPRQADQRDMRMRIRLPQRAQRGHGAQHVAELQRAKDDDALDAAADVHRKNTLN